MMVSEFFLVTEIEHNFWFNQFNISEIGGVFGIGWSLTSNFWSKNQFQPY